MANRRGRGGVRRGSVVGTRLGGPALDAVGFRAGGTVVAYGHGRCGLEAGGDAQSIAIAGSARLPHGAQRDT